VRARCERTVVELCRMTFDKNAEFGSVTPILLTGVRVGSGNRTGLQAGGGGFESGTLHLEKRVIYRTFALGAASADNGGASAVRADQSIRVGRSRMRSSDVELSTRVE
jgi:hypothetical protein